MPFPFDIKTYCDSNSIAKDHDTDAYYIACNTLKGQTLLDVSQSAFQVKQFRRHDRQRIKPQTERTYICEAS